MNCLECKKEISDAAIACPNCGYPVKDPASKSEKPSWNPGVAFLLSLVIPGAGQMYKSRVGAGFLWLFFTVIGYFLFIFPGAILHLICVIDAAIANPKTGLLNTELRSGVASESQS
jgi:TM2 domain-containing membrane protein YozV